ncbi:hypothetical protein DPEC_G00099520 [Dallia pectoralis]|uniref:Uncharacterized protein n=1 Tax=Dallia pectoralis TaxID=75939 RepID=A0ACC2GWC1_DALPE|nr:hypothetical protein DPEC_G00099520 [Dallia pectoralis]
MIRQRRDQHCKIILPPGNQLLITVVMTKAQNPNPPGSTRPTPPQSVVRDVWMLFHLLTVTLLRARLFLDEGQPSGPPRASQTGFLCDIIILRLWRTVVMGILQSV